jgi:acetyl esterase/lipase
MVENKRRDPSLTKFGLDYFTKNLFGTKKLSSIDISKVKDPYASPVYGDFTNFPKTLIFVGGDEILLDDALTLDKKLNEAGAYVKTKITPKMWHCYLVYGLKEHRGDFDIINEFIALKRDIK